MTRIRFQFNAEFFEIVNIKVGQTVLDQLYYSQNDISVTLIEAGPNLQKILWKNKDKLIPNSQPGVY